MAFVKKVLDGTHKETCSRCNHPVGIRAHELDTTWGFNGKLCNNCYQYVVKATYQYEATVVDSSYPHLNVDGSLIFYMFDRRNTMVFAPKQKQNERILMTADKIVNYGVVSTLETSLKKTLLTAGLSTSRTKKFVKIAFDDQSGIAQYLTFDVGGKIRGVMGTIKIILEDKHKNKQSRPGFCDICQNKVGIVKPTLKEGCNIEGMLCQECYDHFKEQMKIWPLAKMVNTLDDFYKKACEICYKYFATMNVEEKNLCVPCFENRFGTIELIRRNAEYHGGHKAFLAGGFATKYELGTMILTKTYLIFIRKHKDPKTWIEIIIPLVSVIISGWHIEEESRRKSIQGAGIGSMTSGFGFGGGFGSGTIHDQGKAHHVVIPYVDENGIPQEPRFGVSSLKGKEIREWSEKIYQYVVEIKKNTPAPSQRTDSTNNFDEPLHFLKIRYAKGEITKEEFESMKKDLE